MQLVVDRVANMLPSEFGNPLQASHSSHSSFAPQHAYSSLAWAHVDLSSQCAVSASNSASDSASACQFGEICIQADVLA